MAIQFPDFQRISFDEANPMLVGMERGQKLGQSAMMFPQDMQAKILANQIAAVQAKYAEPMAGQALTKAQQENQWNPKIWQSEIGLRGAQTGLANQQTQWYGKKTASDIALQNAQTQQASIEAQQNLLKLNYLKAQLGQNGQTGAAAAGGGGGMGQPGMQPTGGSSPAMGGGAATQPQGMQAPASPNGIYGIQTPQLTQADIFNKMMLGMDTFTPKMENAKKQQQDQYDQFQKGLASSIQEANAANSMNQAISVFNQAMDKSFYKGSRLGHAPSSGFLSPPGDLSPEQTADRSALQMLPSAIETLKDAMGSARFSNLDMNMASKMKFDRTMTDDARATQTQWVNGVNDRIMEKSKFLSTLGNPQSGAKKTDADLLWSAYQQDFPLISSDGKSYQGSNLGNWPLYTTPKAIASIQATGTYSPSKSEKNVFMMNVPDGKGGYVQMPIKKGKVESAFRKGAKPL
jgi:hypothetical protein